MSSLDHIDLLVRAFKAAWGLFSSLQIHNFSLHCFLHGTRLFDKPLAQIDEHDLLRLISDKAAESKTHDYKRDLVAQADGNIRYDRKP